VTEERSKRGGMTTPEGKIITDPRNDPGRRREGKEGQAEGSDLAAQRTERLAALEAQPQTVPVGKRTAEGFH
jgi:hypothetical protein